jgi:hypothetical protein
VATAVHNGASGRWRRGWESNPTRLWKTRKLPILRTNGIHKINKMRSGCTGLVQNLKSAERFQILPDHRVRYWQDLPTGSRLAPGNRSPLTAFSLPVRQIPTNLSARVLRRNQPGADVHGRHADLFSNPKLRRNQIRTKNKRSVNGNLRASAVPAGSIHSKAEIIIQCSADSCGVPDAEGAG